MDDSAYDEMDIARILQLKMSSVGFGHRIIKKEMNAMLRLVVSMSSTPSIDLGLCYKTNMRMVLAAEPVLYLTMIGTIPKNTIIGRVELYLISDKAHYDAAERHIRELVIPSKSRNCDPILIGLELIARRQLFSEYTQPVERAAKADQTLAELDQWRRNFSENIPKKSDFH